MKPRRIESRTGLSVTYRVIRDVVSPVTLLLSGGLGGTHLMWTGLARELRRSCGIVIWDYPGLAAGERLGKDNDISISILSQIQKEIMDAESICRACLVGWSMGPQVAFDFALAEPDRVSAIIAVCGTAGSPFHDDSEDEPLAAALGLRAAVPEAVNWITERIDRIEKLITMLKKVPHPTKWAARLGFVDPSTDELIFDAVVRDFLDLDPATYRKYVSAAALHEQPSGLSELDIPVAAFAGQRDRLVPAQRVEELSRAIPGCEYAEIRGATHFLPLEYPQLLALKIEDFIARRL